MEYIIAVVLALVLGQIAAHLIKVLPPILEEPKAHKLLWGALKQKPTLDIKYSIVLAIVFVLLQVFNILNPYLYMFIFFTLLIVFVVDYKYQLIPDTTQVMLGIIGVVATVLDIENILSHVIGMIIGGGTFLLIGLMGQAIFKKESMGFGDVKLMAGLGLIYGMKNITVITILSFFIAAIVSVTLICAKKKDWDSYIPYGPFIVIAALLVTFTGIDIYIAAFVAMVTPLSNLITKLLDWIFELRY